MKKEDRNAMISMPLLIIIGGGIAWAGSQGSFNWLGLPVFGVLVGLAFLIQWIVFIPAYLRQSEKFFDLTGSLTYISLTVLALLLSGFSNFRAVLMAVLVLIWAFRLGVFLYTRVQKAGKDGRFDDLKPSFFRFLNVWTIQGLWVTFTALAAWITITSSNQANFDVFMVVGVLVWLFGFVFEVVADTQKSRFRANPENKGKFINTGLWSVSRHPNYFGEIVLWLGVMIIAIPTLQGWQWIALISPVFVTLLLTRVSGVPLLEDRADEKWGGQEDYETYKQETPVLIPKIKS